jgi:diguanylate cyclase (GGDEF)-like protein/PAS domain S-box-containing protein
VLFWSGLTVLGLVLLRQLLALRENALLRRSLERRVAEVLHERSNLKNSEGRFRSLIENSSDVILILDADLCVRWASDSLETVFGTSPASVTESPVDAILHPDDRARVMRALRERHTDSGWVGSLECALVGTTGATHNVDLHVADLIEDPAVKGIVLNIRDVTERKVLEEQLLHQALHDPLTALPNRVLLVDRLEHELRRSRNRGQRGPAVLFLDLDGFKGVNDTQGHHAGDILLQQVAERLLGAVRPGDSVARMGGDEFAVIVISNPGRDEADRVATRLLTALATPFCIEGHELLISASVGVSMPLSELDSADDLLQQADLAMYQAKELGGNQIEGFVAELKAKVQRRLDTETALRSALAEQRFRLHYQPIVDLTSHTMIGTEALIRWCLADGTLVPPLDFIPLAERSGLIVDIGRWALRAACEQTCRWQRELRDSEMLSVSVNLSARQLRESSFTDDVLDILRDTGLDPNSLILEVTESMVVEDLEKTCEILGSLRGAGIRIAIDDFGTGYSSLSYLRILPVDIIKLDRSFVTSIAANATTSEVARSILGLADALRLTVVAEGIETASQLEELLRLGCRLGQGFHFARPVPGAEIPKVASTLRPAIAASR